MSDNDYEPIFTITEDMVERAARAMFEIGTSTDDWLWEDVLREEPSRADLWRNDCREILAAAALRTVDSPS